MLPYNLYDISCIHYIQCYGSFSYYHLNKTNYKMVYNAIGSKIDWYFDNGSGRDMWAVSSFEKILEDPEVSNEIKNELLFHLNVFK